MMLVRMTFVLIIHFTRSAHMHASYYFARISATIVQSVVVPAFRDM
jgi:hypothetical protein